MPKGTIKIGVVSCRFLNDNVSRIFDKERLLIETARNKTKLPYDLYKEVTRWSESGRNMDLAYALRDELESIGATVVFNREGKVTLTVDERIQILKNAAPDFCIAIHHNSISGYPDISGFECYYYGPFSQLAAQRIYEHTKESTVYKYNAIRWHNYYVSRHTTCPVVLTENGYMSSLYDLNCALNPETIALKAKAMAQGIADYFLLSNP